MGCSLDFTYSFSNTSHVFAYDLCPLISQYQSFKYEISEDTLPTRTNYVYEIALGRGIKKDGTLPTDLQCPHDSLVCMQAINTRPDHPSEPPRILQVIPVAAGHSKPKFRIANTITGTDIREAHLQLTVEGLEYMGMQQKAVFHVFCDKKSPDSSTAQLQHLYRWKGSHVFSWRSEHGCPQITVRDTEDDSDNNPDPDKEEGGKEEEETLPPADAREDGDSIAKPSLKTLLWPITLATCILFIIAAFFKRYKRYILQLIHKLPFSRHHHHRSGEYDFLLEEIASEGPAVYPPGYRKYTV